MNNYVITFRKPYNFEGDEFKEIDLSNIEDLKAKDLVEADRIFVSRGQIAAMNEMSLGYACIIAAKVTQKPIEFFENMPAKEAIRLKNILTRFFYKQD